MGRAKTPPRWLDATGPLFVVADPASAPVRMPERRVLARRRQGSRMLVALPAAAVLIAIAVQVGRTPQTSVFGMAAAVAELVGLAALGSLLCKARGRGWAIAGLVSAVVASGALIPTLRVPVMVAAPAQRPVLRWSQIAGDAPPPLIAVGVLAAALTWVFAGVAVARSGVLGRGDGVLLMLAAPLLAVGGALSGVVTVLGALLVVAAGIGLTGARRRMLPEPPRYSLSDQRRRQYRGAVSDRRPG